MLGGVALLVNDSDHVISHASQRLPDVILHMSFTRHSTALAVIEGLGMRLHVMCEVSKAGLLNFHFYL